jgi:hypothetical protein
MLLAITILATAGRMDRRKTTQKIPACWTEEPRVTRSAAADFVLHHLRSAPADAR